MVQSPNLVALNFFLKLLNFLQLLNTSKSFIEFTYEGSFHIGLPSAPKQQTFLVKYSLHPKQLLLFKFCSTFSSLVIKFFFDSKPHFDILIERKIKLKEYVIKKLSTENKELYGSVKPTEISKIIKDKDNLEIAPSMIQLMDDIKSLGEFKVNINLHSEVQAEIKVKVIPAEVIQ